jgi:hypothetical protein
MASTWCCRFGLPGHGLELGGRISSPVAIDPDVEVAPGSPLGLDKTMQGWVMWRELGHDEPGATTIPNPAPQSWMLANRWCMGSGDPHPDRSPFLRNLPYTGTVMSRPNSGPLGS